MADMIDVKVDARRLELRLDVMAPNVRAALVKICEEDAAALLNALQHLAPRRTGRFARSFRKSVKSTENSVTARVGTRSPLAHLIEGGTRPHDIMPKTAKALDFLGSPGTVFAKLVHHPGTRPNPFISQEFQADMPQIHRDLEDAVKGAAQKS